jgi:glycine oxidase
MNRDLLVVGGGLVGLSTALAAATRGLRVRVFTPSMPGEASRIGAGMLAPSVERSTGAAHDFAIAGREFYGPFLDRLEAATGRRVPLDTRGIFEVAADEPDARRRMASVPVSARWLDAKTMREAAPGLAAPHGAVWHPHDRAVDPGALMDALDTAAHADAKISWVAAPALALTATGIRLADGLEFHAPAIVIASGAWATQLEGLPRPIPVRPMRGQMLEYRGTPTRHVAYGAGGYVVPRANGTTYVGATMDDVGFDAGITPSGRSMLEGVARRLVPALADQPVTKHAAGLRPVTPDLQPIIGESAERPGLWYACGHSRNGFLLGPLTGEVVVDAILGRPHGHDLRPFSIDRFA